MPKPWELNFVGASGAEGETLKPWERGFTEEEKSPLPAGFTKPNGTFKITTNAEILTNNTEEGPETDGDMKVLLWNITERTKSPPMALFKITS